MLRLDSAFPTDQVDQDVMITDGEDTAEGFEVGGLNGLDALGASILKRARTKVRSAVTAAARAPVRTAMRVAVSPIALPLSVVARVPAARSVTRPPRPGRSGLPTMVRPPSAARPGSNVARAMTIRNAAQAAAARQRSVASVAGQRATLASRARSAAAGAAASAAARATQARAQAAAATEAQRRAAAAKDATAAAAAAAARRQAEEQAKAAEKAQAKAAADAQKLAAEQVKAQEVAEQAAQKAEAEATRASVAQAQIQSDVTAAAAADASDAGYGGGYTENYAADESYDDGGAYQYGDGTPAEDSPVPEEYADPKAVEAPEYAEVDAEVAPEDEGVISDLGALLGASPARARATRRLLTRRGPSGEATPADLLTAVGAARLGVAGAKAAAASRAHTSAAVDIERRLTAVAAAGDRLPPGSTARKVAQINFATLSRSLLSERAQAERARVIAGGVKTALTERKAALATRDPSAKRVRFGRAAAAIATTQAFSKTPVRVVLPPPLAASTIRRLADEVGLAVPDSMAAKRLPVRSVPAGTPLRPRIGMPALRVMRAKGPGTVGVGLRPTAPSPRPTSAPMRFPLPQMPVTAFGLDYDDQTKLVISTLQGLGGLQLPASASLQGLAGLDGFADMLKSVTDVAKTVVPSKTIVGKLLAGDVGGAAAGTVKQIVGKPPAPQAPPELSPEQQSLASGIVGSFAPQSNFQLGLLAVGGLLAGGLIYLRVRK